MSHGPAPAPLLLGQYEVLRRLGAGGMAEVFLAKKRGAGGTYKLVVLKRVLPLHGQSRRFRTMFVAEAQLATRLNHPNIVQVYDFQEAGEEGQLLTMEYVEGPDLGRLTSAARTAGVRVPPWVSAYIVSEAAKGLHYAHERKDEAGAPLCIVHRDVSPQNILLSFDGAVKIADFGIASANLFREEAGVLKGKFGYMSPEQARGDVVDRRGDIYALGVCFHELLTGRPLRGALAGDELLEAVRGGEVEPPSTYARDIPPELEAVAMRALAKAPSERFQRARDMAGAIGRAMLVRQELVDAASLEAVIGRLVGREHTLPGAIERSEGAGEGSVIGRAFGGSPRTISDAPAQRAANIESEGGRDPSHAPASRGGPRPVREVRHVALVTLRLFGMDELALMLGRGKAEYAADRLRRTLDEIAYKRGAEWLWSGEQAARAVVGLWSNSSRSAADAAWLAVDVHEALAGASADLPVAIRASVGIVRVVASGRRDDEGRLVDFALQSPADRLAAVLGERTPVGATWVAGGLYRLVRRDFRWGDAPTIGFESEPGGLLPRGLRVYALERPLTRDERIAEAVLASGDLMGRDAEKADLHAAFHRAVAWEEPGGGHRGSVVGRAVVGEMGIGKTALVNAFLAELPPDTFVVRLESSPARGELPFGLAADLVREAAGLEAAATPDEAARAVAGVLGRSGEGAQGAALIEQLVDLTLGKPPRGGDDDESYRRQTIATGVRRLLGALGSRGPLVLVCDGLHWADKPSLELLSELTRRDDALPILSLFVTRPEERVMPYLEGIVRLELRGLSREDQVHLVEAQLGVREGVAQVCDDLLPRVAGNPFFLLELVDALLERGVLELVPTADGGRQLVRVERPGQAREALPSTLDQIIGDRLRELPTEERTVVDWLAVAGGPLGLDVLESLVGVGSREAVVRLSARGVCDQRGAGVDFRHTVTRDVAYATLEAGERRAMHRRLGDRLALTAEAGGLAAALVARHLVRGDAPARAADFYLEAAEAARASYQTQLATRYFLRAVPLLPEGDVRRLRAHEALEGIFRVLGRRRERKRQLAELRALARRLALPRWVAVALVRSARLDLDEGHFSHGLPLAQKAALVAHRARLPALEVESHNVASELLRELGDMQGALAACDRALAVADQSPQVSARARAEVLRARGVLLRWLGRVGEAVDAYAEAIAVFRRCGARRQEARAKNALAYAMFVSERWEDAVALALSAVSIDLAIGGRFQIAKTLTNVGHAYARLGDTPRALAYLKRAREAHERYGDQDSRADTLLVSSEVSLEAGDVDAAASFCGEAAALNAISHGLYDAVHERVVSAQIARARGDLVAAYAAAHEARVQAEGQALVSYHLYAAAIEAVVKVDAGEPHTGILLASTAVSAVENIPTEYGLEVRALACDALARAGSPAAADVRERCLRHINAVGERIREPRLRALFFERATVRAVVESGAARPSGVRGGL